MPLEPLRIFIGFDQREAVAYHVLCHSILARSSIPVTFAPIKRSLLKSIHNRPLDGRQSNEFSYTRFLVPYLSGYVGRSVFMDCDMLVRCDIAELLAECSDLAAVNVVKHDYTPRDATKYLGAIQYPYPRKNWSSVMVFNNWHFSCKRLTPEYVNSATGAQLHQFQWCSDEHIHGLNVKWNHLVGEYAPNPDARIVHWTVGGPWFNEYANAEFANEWFIERSYSRTAVQRADIEAA